MASEVDICNLMMAHLGDEANISEIDPPDGSIQAEHCARFYPIARDSLLEMHDWNFATKRVALTPTTLPDNAGWLYAYLKPANTIRVIAVLPPNAPDNYTAQLGSIPGYSNYDYNSYDRPGLTDKVTDIPQDYALETLEDGTEIILTNQSQATGRVTFRVTDTTKFSPLFVDTLGWYGASMVAGPMIKGDVGAAEAKRCLQFAMGLLGRATTSDSRQQQSRPQQSVPWIGNR